MRECSNDEWDTLADRAIELLEHHDRHREVTPTACRVIEHGGGTTPPAGIAANVARCPEIERTVARRPDCRDPSFKQRRAEAWFGGARDERGCPRSGVATLSYRDKRDRPQSRSWQALNGHRWPAAFSNVAACFWACSLF
jgi:hypothetical protein